MRPYEPARRKLKAFTIGAGILLVAIVIALVAPSDVPDTFAGVLTGHVLVARAVVKVQVVLSDEVLSIAGTALPGMGIVPGFLRGGRCSQ